MPSPEILRARLNALNEVVESLERRRASVRELLDDGLGDEIARQIEPIETRFGGLIAAGHDDALAVLTATADTRIGARIAPVERALSVQAAALAEIRESSTQTEAGVERLLVGIRRHVEVKEARLASEEAARAELAEESLEATGLDGEIGAAEGEYAPEEYAEGEEYEGEYDEEYEGEYEEEDGEGECEEESEDGAPRVSLRKKLFGRWKIFR